MKFDFLAAGLLALGVASADAVNAGEVVETVQELRERGGLPNLAAKIRSGKHVNIAYLGGSITDAADGWRSKSFDWFVKRFPKAKFRELRATVCGTNADFGAARFKDDVLSQGVPDLLFVEFRCNGADTRSVEGIVRQLWKVNPNADICFVYTIWKSATPTFRKGVQTNSGAALEKIAGFYGIPSVDFAPDIIARLDAGKIVYTKDEAKPGQIVFTRDTVHPTPEGHDLYVEVLTRSLEKLLGAGKKGEHSLARRFHALPGGCYDECELVPAARFLKDVPGWTKVDEENDAVYTNDRRRTQQMLRGAYAATEEGATFTIRYYGKAIAFSDIPQTEEMLVETILDGGKPMIQRRIRSAEWRLHSRFWYVWSPNSLPGEHTLKVTVKKLPKGQKFFCGQLQVYGGYFIK